MAAAVAWGQPRKGALPWLRRRRPYPRATGAAAVPAASLTIELPLQEAEAEPQPSLRIELAERRAAAAARWVAEARQRQVGARESAATGAEQRRLGPKVADRSRG